MIISRSPFRVSLCGGGSDLPSFYERFGGAVISTTIRKYMYVTIHPAFSDEDIILKYSKTEHVKKYSDIEHKIFHRVLEDYQVQGVEITSISDVPSGTGLGSSSSFTTALLMAIHAYQAKYVSKYRLAKEACDIEITRLGNPIGKQDQFAASFGGLNYYEFLPDGFVQVEPIIMSPMSYKTLEKRLMLFYTGIVHDANVILKEQNTNIATQIDKINGTKELVKLTKKLKDELSNNNIDALGNILDQSWKIKKSLANGITDHKIDYYYEQAIKAGALGGKLLGAGGGGFLLFYVYEENQDSVRKALHDLKEFAFEMDNAGTTIVFYG